jgi:hypothetical protein
LSVLRLRREERPPSTEGNCEGIKKATAIKRQGGWGDVRWARDLTVKKLIRHRTSDLGGLFT